MSHFVLVYSSMLLGAIAFGQSAHGFTLMNNDAISYRIEVIENEQPEYLVEFELSAGEEIAEFCLDGCNLSVDGGDFMPFSAYRDVEIKNGKIQIATSQA